MGTSLSTIVACPRMGRLGGEGIGVVIVNVKQRGEMKRIYVVSKSEMGKTQRVVEGRAD